MIKSVTVTNIETGADLKLTLASPEDSQGFAVVNMDGLGPGQATITTNEWVAIDGASVVYTHVPKRNITMELRFIPRNGLESVADIRRRSYLYFPLKKKIHLLFETRDNRNNTMYYAIDGYVEKNEPKIWSEEEGTNISIICENPYFEGTTPEYESFTQIEPSIHFALPTADQFPMFPVSKRRKVTDTEAFNTCTMDVGGIFLIKANGNVVNPLIYNVTTNERLGLNYTMTDGEIIIIDTRMGQKSIRDYVTKENKLQYLMINSKWLTFRPGINIIGIHADAGFENMDASLEFQTLYPGI